MADKVQTTGAEALNRNIRHLNSENIVPFFYLRMLFLNLRAHLRDKTGISAVDGKDFYLFANEFLPCTCRHCSLAKSSG